MPRIDPLRDLVPSLIDRLAPPDLGAGGPAGGRAAYAVEDLVEEVRRDLEDLLNTRQPNGDLPAEFRELTDSVFTFGVPDAAILSTLALDRPDEIARLMVERIGRFEPRLDQVEVRVDPAQNLPQSRVRLRIEARLRVGPGPDIGFITVLELATGRATITPDEGASA